MLSTTSSGQKVGEARLAQSVERLALNQVVVGSSPTVGASFAILNIFLLPSLF